MAVDVPIEKLIGNNGRYQIVISILMLFGRLPTDLQLINVVFLIPNVNYVCMDEDAFNMTNHCPCKSPQYDQSAIISSATSEWNLICERTPLASVAQSLMHVGILIGSFIFGYTSDRFGRRKSTLLAYVLMPATGTLSAFTSEFWMFVVVRFLAGIATGGVLVASYTLMIEISGKTMRPYMALLNESSHSIATIILPFAAYYFREWRHLQLVTATPAFILFAYFLFLPESPRWLLTVGKKEEAIATIKTIMNINKISTTEPVEETVNEMMKSSQIDGKYHRGSYRDLFKTRKIRIYTIVSALLWTCCAHIYYALNQLTGRLEGNIYLNVILSGVFQIPGFIIIALCNIYFSRKVLTISSFVLAGLLILVHLFIPIIYHVVARTFAILSYVAMLCAFVLIYLYGSEIFPTVIRNSAIGFLSMLARVGGLAAPFVVNINSQWISFAILSVLCFCSVLLCCFLPETKNKVLLNTIEETERSQ